MRLNEIKRIWATYNRDIFAANGAALPEANHRRTRARKYWACWDFNTQSYIWNYKLEGVECIKSMIAHEMVHHWQDVYMHTYYANVPHGYDYHDLTFYSWSDIFALHGLILSKDL